MERALTVATNLSVCAFGDELTLALCHLATHAENARLRRRIRDARSAMVTHPRDWSTDHRDAWLYGIIVGWSDESLEALADKHGWSTKMLDKLRECREQEPKMTETPAETGPSDEPTAYAKWVREWMASNSGLPVHHEAFAAGYTAGRASLAGKLAANGLEIDKLREMVAKQGEIGMKLKAALEAEKAAHEATSVMLGAVIRERDAARQARVMPSEQALADCIYGAVGRNEFSRGDAEDAADAVRRLLAPTQGASSDPPVPLPGVLPVGTRADAGGADVEATRDAFLEMNTVNGPCYWSRWSGGLGFIRARDIDWAHYRAQRPQPSEPYVPSVGERAVLVASPDPIDRDLVGEHVGICGKDTSSVDSYWKVAAFGAYGTNREVHRDATWRRAEPQGEAKPARDATIRRNARPVEPATDPIEALSKRVAAVERRVRELDQRTVGSAK
jgi:hypothetical protein